MTTSWQQWSEGLIEQRHGVRVCYSSHHLYLIRIAGAWSGTVVVHLNLRVLAAARTQRIGVCRKLQFPTMLHPTNNSFFRAMRGLIDDPLFSDVVFDVQGEVIRAHRAIVSARCESLGAMLKSGMSESDNSKPIVIRGCKSPTFHALLVYLYSDSIVTSGTNQ
jgi:hypothetical protein